MLHSPKATYHKEYVDITYSLHNNRSIFFFIAHREAGKQSEQRQRDYVNYINPSM